MSHPRISNYDVLQDLEAHLALASRLEHDIDDWTGPSSSTGGGGGQKGTHTDPTLATVLSNLEHASPTERLINNTRQYLDELEDIKRKVIALNSKRHQLAYIDLASAKLSVNERTTPSTIGFCEGCDRNCDARDDNHKLIAGLCNACRQAFKRYPRTSGDPGGDRRAFIDQRRRETTQRRKHVG